METRFLCSTAESLCEHNPCVNPVLLLSEGPRARGRLYLSPPPWAPQGGRQGREAPLLISQTGKLRQEAPGLSSPARSPELHPLPRTPCPLPFLGLSQPYCPSAPPRSLNPDQLDP